MPAGDVGNGDRGPNRKRLSFPRTNPKVFLPSRPVQEGQKKKSLAADSRSSVLQQDYDRSQIYHGIHRLYANNLGSHKRRGFGAELA
mgnify:CR=1 FL=1